METNNRPQLPILMNIETKKNLLKTNIVIVIVALSLLLLIFNPLAYISDRMYLISGCIILLFITIFLLIYFIKNFRNTKEHFQYFIIAYFLNFFGFILLEMTLRKFGFNEKNELIINYKIYSSRIIIISWAVTCLIIKPIIKWIKLEIEDRKKVSEDDL